jgi:predicted nucleic acid-binding protein
MSVVYDTGVLLAAERGNREIWADHRVRLELGIAPWTTAPVVAQASRSPRQAQLRRLLRGCQIEPFAAERAHEVGALLGKAGAADVVDAHVVVTAASRAATVLTSDPSDLQRLSDRLAAPVPVRRI